MCGSMVDIQSTAAEIRPGKKELECGPMPNVMVALLNIGEIRRGKKKERRRKIEITGQKYNGLPSYIGRP